MDGVSNKDPPVKDRRMRKRISFQKDLKVSLIQRGTVKNAGGVILAREEGISLERREKSLFLTEKEKSRREPVHRRDSDPNSGKGRERGKILASL